VTDDPGEIGPVDLVLLCVKSYDLEQAAKQVVPLIGPNTVVITPQNGIDIVERLIPFFGKRPIVPAVKIPYKLSLGEWEGGISARTERLLDLFQRAGFLVELREDIRAYVWEKFIVSCASLGVLALMRLPVGPVMVQVQATDGTSPNIQKLGKRETLRQVSFSFTFSS